MGEKTYNNDNASKNINEKIFITVGTTLFNQLIETISSKEFIHNITSKNRSYNELTIQYGKGNPPNIITRSSSEDDINESFLIESYKYKPSLQDDMISSSLIISHAGAGSIMECLALHKKTIVVINNKLMNNHQYELAEALYKRGYLICVHDVTKLLDAHFWDNVVDCFVPKIWNGGDDMAFSFLLDDQMNYLIGNHNDEDKVD